MAYGPIILSGQTLVVYDAPSVRRKLGVLGYTEPEIDVILGSLTLTEPLGVESGGTGLGGCSAGDLLVGIAPNVWARLPAGAAGMALLSQGPTSSPYWNQLGLEAIRNRLTALEERIVTNAGEIVRQPNGEPIWA